MSTLEHIFDTSGFVPRAVCGDWTTGEVLLNNVSDLFIALAYLAIPTILIYFARRREDLPFSWMFWVFGAFIVTCGATHVLEIVLFYHPVYRLAGWVKLLTAVASWGAAIALIKIAPAALALRSPQELEKLNQELQVEIESRRRAELELAEKNRKLQESERLKDEFLANVSHELRTPLTLVLSPVETLLAASETTLVPEQRRTLEMVRANAVRLLQQVNDLLDFSRFQAGKLEIHREPTPIVGYTRTLVQSFDSLAEEHELELSFQGEGEQGRLLDRYLYERILFNLVSNAVKYTPAGGSIDVRLRLRDDRLELEVQDSGTGIPLDELQHLFERFRQVRSNAGRSSGTGLGLALVKEFASVLGGGVSVESAPGEGSTFRVELLAPSCELPEEFVAVSDRPRVPSSVQLPTLPEPSQKLPRVLIAEDNPELASYMAVVLRGVAQVKVVRDGREALEAVDTWQPELVLSDVMMPHVSGFQLCRQLKSETRLANLPVVLITALTHREALLEGWEAGADEFLFKPFHPTELVTRVRSLLGIAQARQELEQQLRGLNTELERRVGERSRELSQALAQAQTANRAKSEFLGNLSHELRTPMTGILGLTELALDQELEPELRQSLLTVRRAAAGLDGLLEDLLEFSRLESGRLVLRPAPFQLHETVEQVRATLEREAQDKNLHLGVQLAGTPPPPLMGDEAKLRHVLLNLLANAVKFTEEGSVTLKAHTFETRDGHVRVRFEVEDTGIGVAPEHQETIFEPFTQSDASLAKRKQGVGLGLAIARNLVTLLGGTLEVESCPGEGSTFSFELDLAVAEDAAVPPAGPWKPSVTGKILVVEDNPINRKVITMILERVGHQVTAVVTAGEALALDEPFDLVLLDLQLPDMDGVEAARHFQERSEACPPLVALTAHAGDHYREMCRAAGMSDFLSKPIDSETLLRTVERLIQ